MNPEEEKEEYLLSVDKQTYDLIKQYRADDSPASQPFTMKQISFSAQMMIREYMKSKGNFSLPWTSGVLAVFALEILFMPAKSWIGATVGDTVLHFIAMFILALFGGLLVGLLLGTFDHLLKENLNYSQTKLKQSIFPLLTLIVLLIFTVLYAGS